MIRIATLLQASLALVLSVGIPAAAAYAALPESFYAQYDKVLKAYVNDQGMVNYAGLKSDRAALDQFIEDVATLEPQTYESLSEAEKIAFLTNAYNALTLQLIINNYPIKAGTLTSLVYPRNSIRQISGAWDKTTHTVAGKKVTLNDIEHNMLRKEFNEPGIHMALVCAAMSCPKLRNEPFFADRLSDQLADQARHFFSDNKKFTIDREKKKVKFSPIFDWFGDDFVKTYGSQPGFEGYGRKERSILNYAARHVSAEDKEFLEHNNLEIEFLDYDWTLNEQPRQ